MNRLPNLKSPHTHMFDSDSSLLKCVQKYDFEYWTLYHEKLMRAHSTPRHKKHWVWVKEIPTSTWSTFNPKPRMFFVLFGEYTCLRRIFPSGQPEPGQKTGLPACMAKPMCPPMAPPAFSATPFMPERVSRKRGIWLWLKTPVQNGLPC